MSESTALATQNELQAPEKRSKSPIATAMLKPGTIDPWVELTIEGRYDMCRQMASSGMIPYTNPAQAFAVHLYGLEMGIAPMKAFQGIHIFDDGKGGGRMAVSAQIMSELAKQTGLTWKVTEHTAQRVAMKFFREGFPDLEEVEWTWEMAETAGLARKHNWKTYPRAMLTARCMADGVRLYAPDRCADVYLAQELEDVGLRRSDEVDPTLSTSASKLNEMIDAAGEPEKPEPIEPPKADSDWIIEARKAMDAYANYDEASAIEQAIKDADQAACAILVQGLIAKHEAQEGTDEEDAAEEDQPEAEEEA